MNQHRSSGDIETDGLATVKVTVEDGLFNTAHAPCWYRIIDRINIDADHACEADRWRSFVDAKAEPGNSSKCPTFVLAHPQIVCRPLTSSRFN